LAPRKKNARRRNAWLIFFDESGISLLPVVRRTWAPRGKTPVIRHHFNWKRLSIAGALCYHSRRRRARVYLHTHPGAYKDFVLMDVITQLGRELRGDRATLLWDGLAGHTSGAMKAFLATQRQLSLYLSSLAISVTTTAGLPTGGSADVPLPDSPYQMNAAIAGAPTPLRDFNSEHWFQGPLGVAGDWLGNEGSNVGLADPFIDSASAKQQVKNPLPLRSRGTHRRAAARRG
jgi:hypothetical protein